MGLRVYLVQWDEEAAISRLARLASMGWTVFSESKDGEAAYQGIRTTAPDLVIFDLAAKPAHSLQVAEALRKCRSLQTLPFLFVDGDARSLHNTQQRILNAEFATSEDLIKAIEKYSKKPVSCSA